MNVKKIFKQCIYSNVSYSYQCGQDGAQDCAVLSSQVEQGKLSEHVAMISDDCWIFSPVYMEQDKWCRSRRLVTPRSSCLHSAKCANFSPPFNQLQVKTTCRKMQVAFQSEKDK
jgi:hypothetical protein